MAMGDAPRAEQLIAEARAENPDLATDFIRANENFEDPRMLETLLDRLRRAGLPDPPEGVLPNLPRRVAHLG